VSSFRRNVVARALSCLPWARGLPWLVLALGLAASGALRMQALDGARADLQEHFDDDAQELAGRIKVRGNAYAQVLRGLSGLFSASRSVTGEEFRAYVQRQRLEEEFPGLQSVGLAWIVPAPRGPGPGPERQRGDGRAFSTSIAYIEPRSSRNLSMLRYDPYSDSARREAMERARDLGEVAVTRKLGQLSQESESEQQAGFLMYMPVYASGAATQSVAERRANIIGWVFLAMRMGDFVAGARVARDRGLEISVVDGNLATREAMIFTGPGAQRARAPLFNTSARIEWGAWTAHVSSLPAFEARLDTSRADALAISGILLSVFASLIAWLLLNARARARAIAQALMRELEQSEFRWQFALEGAGAALWDWNLEDGQVFYSTRWKQMLGYAEHEIGDGVDEMKNRIHPEDLERVLDRIRAALKGDSLAYVSEHRFRCKDGSWKWMLDQGLIVCRTKEGRPERMIGTMTDLTQRRQEEERLRNLTQALEQSQVAALITSTEGVIEYVNAKFSDITGYSRDEAIGRSSALIKSGLTPLGVYQALWSTIKSGRVWQGEMQNRRKNGEIYWEKQVISPVLDKRGEIVNFIGVKEDITERKRVDAALLRYQHHLVEMVAERTAQSRSLAMALLKSEARERRSIAEDLHDDLCQTLAVAKLKLNGLQVTGQGQYHYKGDQDDFLQQVREIEAMIDRSNRSVRSLAMQLSPPVLHQFGLGAALEWLAEEMKLTYALSVNVLLGDLVPLDETTGSALYRSVRELLINVWKHARVHEAEVTLSIDSDQGRLTVSVADAGVGFDVKRARTPSADNSYGLYSIGERIRFMGGTMQIDSEAGRGTIVTLTLSLAQAEANRPAAMIPAGAT